MATRLKLIDPDLLLSIIKTCKGVQPPTHQDLLLSSNADSKMQELLNKPATDKTSYEYANQLNKRSLYLDKYNDDIQQQQPTPSTPSTPSSSSETNPHVVSTDTDQITKWAGKMEKNRMLHILDRLKSSDSKLKWNANYQLVENGVPIQGTNLFDLLRTVTTKSERITPTPGLSRFAYHLNLLNTPMTTAGNKNIRNVLKTGVVDSSLDPLLAGDTTIRPLKRKRNTNTTGFGINKKLISNWE